MACVCGSSPNTRTCIISAPRWCPVCLSFSGISWLRNGCYFIGKHEGALVCSDATRPTALLHDASTCTTQSHNGRDTALPGQALPGAIDLEAACAVCSGYGSQRSVAPPGPTGTCPA